MIKKMSLLLSVVATFFLTSCGPEKPAIDRTKEELISRNQKEVANLPLIVGFYTGTWTSLSGDIYKAAVTLYLAKERRKLPLEGEEIEVTVLRGSIYIYDADPKLPLQGLGAVQAGSYDPSSGQITLTLGPVQGSANSGETREFSGTLKDGVLEGTLPIKGAASALKVGLVIKL